MLQGDAERDDDRFARSDEISARAPGSDAAAADPRAFDQKEKGVGEQIRLRCPGGPTESGKTIALADFEVLDHSEPWVILLR